MLKPKIASGFRFQWEPVQQNFVLLYPEGMVKLNQTAGEILSVCDGVKTISEIVKILEEKFSTPGLAPQIEDFLKFAVTKGWVCEGV